jgi:tRNA dimethylallyltransferase
MFSRFPELNLKKVKLITILGPTSSGKSELAVQVAGLLGNAEILSADSRQVYKGLNIGSGKVEGQFNSSGQFEYKCVIHHLIDVANPKIDRFTVSDFQVLGSKILEENAKANKFSIICGGTGMYIDSLVNKTNIPEVKPNQKLRAELETFTTAELFEKLASIDVERSKNIDSQNRRRLVRAIEIVTETGKPVPSLTNTIGPDHSLIWVGLNPGQERLDDKIMKRMEERFKLGMIDEVKGLVKDGLTHEQLESFGLEYKYISLHLRHELGLEDMKTQLFHAIRQYSKRQMTWWKRNPNIKWFASPEEAYTFIAGIF